MGAVIEGKRGSGKRHAVEVAVESEGYSGSVYRLAGTRYGYEVEFGALQFLLVDLPDEQIMSPVIVFSELRRYFAGGPDKPLFILEKITFIDPWSVTVLSQLVQAGLIRIFVIDDNETALNEDILSLVRSETLENWRVLPMTFVETENRIKEFTGLSPSSLLTATLWTYSEGNAEWLEALMGDGMEHGRLIRNGDSLIMASRGIQAEKRTLELARSWMEGLSLVQRQVLEIVASAGVVSPPQLESTQLAEIDTLYESGLLEYVHEPVVGVSLASRVLGDCLVSMLSSDWHIDIGIRPVVKNRLETAAARFDTLGMRLISDAGLEPNIREMLSTGRVKQALFGVSEERKRSYGDLANEPAARNSTGVLSSEEINLLALELRLALRAGESALACQLTAVIDPIRNGFRQNHLSSKELHRASASLLDSLVRSNRNSEAKELMNWLTDVCLQRTVQGTELETEPCSAHSIRALMSAGLALGEWDVCRDLVTWVLDGPLRDPQVIAYAKIIEGILAAVSGDVETARIRLVPIERQLSLTGPPEDHEAIAGILAYCHMATGSSTAAVHLLPQAETIAATSTCFGWIAIFFRIMAVSRIYSSESGHERLLTLIDDSTNPEGAMFQLHALALRLRMGDHDAASALRETCRGNRSLFAEAYGLLAEGVLEQKPDSIVSGLQTLIGLGFAEYAAEPENHLLLLVSPGQQRLIARFRILQRSPKSDDVEEQPETLDQIRIFDLLTKRERFVAAAAARGMSNLEIADKASVSVRTVEGHLYQVYSKLTIQGRAELHNLAASLTRKPADSHV